mmetsp:Transcript_8672/g.19849  ORF Transcript_8672/g.19849 Transcript_8672/m.19849 type:complete len:291 (-) Transcript_8672:704-1576(-)
MHLPFSAGSQSPVNSHPLGKGAGAGVGGEVWVSFPVYKRALGDSAFASPIAFFVERARRRSSTSFAVRLLSSPINKAAPPATWGHAMEVPLIVASAESPLCPAEVMELPGAKMSRHLPMLLKPDRESVEVVDPTVIASGAFAGEYSQASGTFESPSFPAATTTTTPSSVAFWIALFTDASLALPPRLALMIAGFTPFETTQSMASVNHEKLPPPLSARTLTACRVASLATPYFLPPMVPAQCVPCPLTGSFAHVVSSEAHTLGVSPSTSRVGTARPSKSLWVVRMPVSST